ncbi:MAG TPA: DUF4198 domain-containing protein [Sphingobium sp.]
MAVALPLSSANAHRQWILPSATTVDDEGAYVTVDAAVSETLFDFDSFPLKVDGITIIGPDGQLVQPENVSAGKRRSTFDVKLPKAGTYRIALVTTGAMGSYTVGGEQKRFRGTEAELATAIPKDATDVRITRSEGRLESFVTVGEPTALKPVGKGLEIVALTNPTENVVGTPAKFRALIDGKPTSDIDITIVPGGGRFRANLGDTSVKTDAKGEVTVNWPVAGYVWLGASWPPRPAMPEGGQGGPGGQGGGQGAGRPAGAGGPGGGERGPAVPRRLSYSATFEVAPF